MDRVPQESETIEAGDLVINSVILKSINIETSDQRLKSIKDIKASAIKNCEYSGGHFWVTDGNRNTFKIIPAQDWFQKGKHDLGGVVGSVIGVSDMEKSLLFYQNVLGIDIYPL